MIVLRLFLQGNLASRTENRRFVGFETRRSGTGVRKKKDNK